MDFSRRDFDTIDKRLKYITQQSVETIEISNDVPPKIDELADSNKAYVLKAAILFIDIRKSTYLTENSQAKSMVKIYRAFMRMAVSCVRTCGGVTRQFIGDRIMGIFLDSVDDEGNILDSAVDKAVLCARAMQTCIEFSLNKQLKQNVNGKIISCGIGVDYGKVLLTKVGMYGVEKDESKENEIECVWIGNCTNRASKYADIAEGGEIFVSENVYRKLSEKTRPSGIWYQAAKNKNGSLFKGWIASGFYVEFSNELGDPIIPNDVTGNDDVFNLAMAIENIDIINQRLSAKELELRVLEERLKQLEQYNDSVATQNKKDRYELDRQNEKLVSKYNEMFNSLVEYLEYSHCKDDYISKMGMEFWNKLIKEIFEIGKLIGKTDRQITRQLDCYLIGIYDYFEIFHKAYETMLIMAEDNCMWVSIRSKTVLWAKEQKVIWQLKSIMEIQIQQNNCTCYQHYYDELKKIVED